MCERKRLQVFLHKCFQISCYLLFVFTSYMDGDCVSALDAETHQGKHFAGISFLAVLFNRDSARNDCLHQFCDRYTLEQIAGCAATIDSYIISPYLCLNANPFFFRVTYTYANCKYKETDQQNARICTDFRPTLEQNVAA